jgi:hypothetical protein
MYFQMRSMIQILTVLLVSTLSCSAQDSVFLEGPTGPFYGRAVVWKDTELNRQNLQSYFEQLVRELRSYRAWNVWVFVNKDDATRELFGKLRSEETYDWWLTLYNEFGRELLPMAEFLTYENNTVLRLRDRAGLCSETVLSGDNFLRVRDDGVDYDILQIYYGGLPPHTQSAPGDEAMIQVYVRSSVFPTVEQASRFSLLMRDRFRQKRIIVTIRTDSYFILDGRFPIVYRFDQDGTPPTPEEYERSKTMYCFCERPEIRCVP